MFVAIYLIFFYCFVFMLVTVTLWCRAVVTFEENFQYLVRVYLSYCKVMNVTHSYKCTVNSSTYTQRRINHNPHYSMAWTSHRHRLPSLDSFWHRHWLILLCYSTVVILYNMFSWVHCTRWEKFSECVIYSSWWFDQTAYMGMGPHSPLSHTTGFGLGPPASLIRPCLSLLV